MTFKFSKNGTIYEGILVISDTEYSINRKQVPVKKGQIFLMDKVGDYLSAFPNELKDFEPFDDFTKSFMSKIVHE